MIELIYKDFDSISEAVDWANNLVGNFLPGSADWMVDEILQFQFFFDESTTDCTLVLLLGLIAAGDNVFDSYSMQV